jgi:hypothetical protein
MPVTHDINVFIKRYKFGVYNVPGNVSSPPITPVCSPNPTTSIPQLFVKTSIDSLVIGDIVKYNQKLRKIKNRYAEMKNPVTFPTTTNLFRLTCDNAIIGQIIMFKVKGDIVFSVITKINPTVVSVNDLILKTNSKNQIEFYIDPVRNPVHKGNVGFTRKIHIINSDEYIVL